jgi:hypothetical protein
MNQCFRYSYYTTVRVLFACYKISEFFMPPLMPAHKDCPIFFIFFFESIQYCYIQYVTIVEAHSSFLTAVTRKNLNLLKVPIR